MPETGRLRLRAELRGGRTVIAAAERAAPFGLGPPSYRDPAGRAELIVQQTGPGLLPGDRVEVEIAVGPGARLVVRGQSATRLYPCPAGSPIAARTLLRVETGGELLYLPGELIPYRNAELRQETVLEVAPGGRCAAAEILAAGRLAMGERDAYRLLALDLAVRRGDLTVLIERARLAPGCRSIDAPGRHGSFPVAASLVVVGGRLEAPLVERSAACVTAAGERGGVVVARSLALRTELCRAAIERLALATIG